MVVYNHLPDVPSLEAALAAVDRLVLVDNHSSPEVREALEAFAHRFPQKCRLVALTENAGLSRAYNAVVRDLRAEGIHWLHFFDHDATFTERYFRETHRVWQQLLARGLPVGVVVPIVTDDPTYQHRRLGFRREWSRLQSTMTSGILTNVGVFSGLGGFDERLFVDAVDLDFTSRANRAGAGVFLVNRVLIVQQFGAPPDDERLPTRIANFLMRLRSFVRVGIGNSNMLRTRLFTYPPARQQRLYAALRWIISERYPWRNQARLTYVLDKIEELYGRHFVRFLVAPSADVAAIGVGSGISVGPAGPTPGDDWPASSPQRSGGTTTPSTSHTTPSADRSVVSVWDRI